MSTLNGILSSLLWVVVAGVLTGCGSEEPPQPSGGGTTGVASNTLTGGASRVGSVGAVTTGSTSSNGAGGAETVGAGTSFGSAGDVAGDTSVSVGGPSSAGGASDDGSMASGGQTTGGGFGGFSTSGGETTNHASGAGGSATTGTTSGHMGTWRIMPLGDSITETTCYPQLLSKTLIDNGHTEFEFVGSVLNNQSCGATNVYTEGHGGYLVTDLVGNGQHASEPAGWFSAAQAEVVVMHFGTNDVWNDVPPESILSAYSAVLDGLRSVNPNVIVFVAQIIPMNPSGCSECGSRVEALNAEIPAWAANESTSSSPLYVVDLHTGFDTASDTRDGVHPNPAGSQKMADKLYAAMVAQGIP